MQQAIKLNNQECSAVQCSVCIQSDYLYTYSHDFIIARMVKINHCMMPFRMLLIEKSLLSRESVVMCHGSEKVTFFGWWWPHPCTLNTVGLPCLDF